MKVLHFYYLQTANGHIYEISFTRRTTMCAYCHWILKPTSQLYQISRLPAVMQLSIATYCNNRPHDETREMTSCENIVFVITRSLLNCTSHLRVHNSVLYTRIMVMLTTLQISPDAYVSLQRTPTGWRICICDVTRHLYSAPGGIHHRDITLWNSALVTNLTARPRGAKLLGRPAWEFTRCLCRTDTSKRLDFPMADLRK